MDNKFPQKLSNGCEYNNDAFAPYQEKFEPYYNKIIEFVGDENYKKLNMD